MIAWNLGPGQALTLTSGLGLSGDDLQVPVVVGGIDSNDNEFKSFFPSLGRPRNTRACMQAKLRCELAKPTNDNDGYKYTWVYLVYIASPIARISG
eukprot:38134-Pelagomonas_calceolata.AAC.2